ncbi:MAG: biopolymer transporter ExbD, partial [Bacteroidota bacterium]|nr:biopolymer transporter ExbD [Bacteroidota bacterium]
RLPPPSDPSVKPPDIHKRNTFVVLVNMNDQLLVNGEPGDINSLKERTMEFLANPKNAANLPEKKRQNINLIGDYDVSQGVISLQNDRGTSYKMYLQVQNELVAAVNELRNDLAKEKFSRGYADCNNEQKEAIDKAIPAAISEAEPKNVGDKKKGGK